MKAGGAWATVENGAFDMEGTDRRQATRKAHFLPSGDSALTVELGDTVDRGLSEDVVGLAANIHGAALSGVVEVVPTFRSLLVHYDPLVTSAASLTEQIGALLDHGRGGKADSRKWLIPACYEGSLAPDLEEVAARSGLSPSQVIEQHTATVYHVYMLGFLPGYPYMGDLPELLQLPRRETPRVRVLPGSVAIATALTAVYTYECPGGWHLIGRTPIPLFDIQNDPPALLRPGDMVSFDPVSRETFDRLAEAVENGDLEAATVAAA